MSLYNMLHGQNQFSRLLLDMLNLNESDFGRFRDVYIGQHDGKSVIRVHTRCGGGNRESYQKVFGEMRTHKNFLFDEDDGFDSTYCDFVFSVPDGFEELVAKISENTDNSTPRERWEKVLTALRENKPGDPIAERAAEIGKAILGPIVDGMKDGKGVTVVKL